MLKKISLAFCIFCISATSHAYLLKTNFTVENKTDVPLLIEIEQPNGQETLKQPLPAHKKIDALSLNNNDNTGLLYQTATAPFKIKSVDGKVYAQGRIAYYVGASWYDEYSFIDAVSTAEDITIDPTYICRAGTHGKAFNNDIVIEGTPDKTLKMTDFPQAIKCKGVKTSRLSEDQHYYNVTCSNNSSFIYSQKSIMAGCNLWTCETMYQYANGIDSLNFKVSWWDSSFIPNAEMKENLDNIVCGNWV